jgi:hypothetical protein
MSVTCILYAAEEMELQHLLRQPEQVHAFLDPPRQRQSFLQRLLGRSVIAAETRPGVASFDLGKSWHAIHWGLSGTADDASLPAGFLTSGGAWVGREDVGYGPARVLLHPEVSSVNNLLSTMPTELLAQRLDLRRMRPQHVYSVPPQDDPEWLTLLLADYDALRSFLRNCADTGRALLVQYV